MINSFLASFLVFSLASVAPLSREIVRERREEANLMPGCMADHKDLFDPNLAECVHSFNIQFFFCFFLFFFFFHFYLCKCDNFMAI